MHDLAANREKFLQEAADCDLIGILAGDVNKRETFRDLASVLRELADEFAADIAAENFKN